MSIEATLPAAAKKASASSLRTSARTRNRPAPISAFRSPSGYGQIQEQEPLLRQAELFYLQKQIQSQTPMVLILEDGEQIEGCIEWYDRNTLKVRGRQKTMVYKSAIKYMYKLGDPGQ